MLTPVAKIQATIDIGLTSFRVLISLGWVGHAYLHIPPSSLAILIAMRRSTKKLGKSLKVLQATSDGHGGSRLLEKKYVPTSPSKKVKPTESPPKSKKQRTDDPVFDFSGLDEYPLVEEETPSDPRSTKVSGDIYFPTRCFGCSMMCRHNGTT